MTPHPDTVGAAPEPDYTRTDPWTPYELGNELQAVDYLMRGAGRRGPLRDTVAALIADELQASSRVADLERTNRQLSRDLQASHRAMRVADEIETRVRAERDEAERRASWVLGEAMSYCVNRVRGDDD